MVSAESILQSPPSLAHPLHKTRPAPAWRVWAVVQLRDYQTTAVRTAQQHLQANAATLIVAPTGAGKTAMASAVLSGYRRPAAIVHTSTLADQITERVPSVKVYTVQSLLRSRVALDDLHDVVWLDEAHHYVASAWDCVWGLAGRAPVLGVTATPEREDGIGLGERFRRMVVAAQYGELIRAGHLCPADTRTTIGACPADMYERHGNGRPAIIFTRTCRQAQEVATKLAGFGAATVDSHSTVVERRAAIAAFDAGRLQVLVSPSALAEGFDSPRAEVCVLGRPCGSLALYLQACGRVLRPSPGKRRALILDCCGAVKVHGPPTLERRYSLKGKGITADLDGGDYWDPTRRRQGKKRAAPPGLVGRFFGWLFGGA